MTGRLVYVTAAPQLFVVVASEKDPCTIIGYACGTATRDRVLTHECMSTHDPEGSTVCLHSVCIAAQRRRQGLALRCAQFCNLAFLFTLQTVEGKFLQLQPNPLYQEPSIMRLTDSCNSTANICKLGRPTSQAFYFSANNPWCAGPELMY